MHKAWQLQRRTERFAVLVEALAVHIADSLSAQKTVRRLLTTTRAMVIGYEDASASTSPEKFIAGISAVASNAKKTRAALVLLVELGHLSIEVARESILEARGLEESSWRPETPPKNARAGGWLRGGIRRSAPLTR